MIIRQESMGHSQTSARLQFYRKLPVWYWIWVAEMAIGAWTLQRE